MSTMLSVIIVQAVGLAAMIIGFFTYTSRTRKRLITFKLISDVIWAIHYYGIGATSGAVLNLINVIRDVIFQMKTAKKWASHGIWVAVFILISSFSTIMTWQGVHCMLPLVGSSLSVWGLWCENPVNIRIFIMIATICWMIYDVMCGSYVGILGNLIQLVSLFVGLFQDIESYRKDHMSI